ncbi:hypothetical protein IW261DRAFT_1423130 [Armillaria novae-zelandiae]|uniref:Uncharacterized protein n=1 Tax=Armillaria novae-zelandiae TaxID=153914 RepID=A0AA39NZ84_9AGAR|nr:hypothetical protein IW261DRAFT_1423130 [Armillaria novae-zelandiae]
MRWQLHIEPGYQMGMNGLSSLELDDELPAQDGIAPTELLAQMWTRTQRYQFVTPGIGIHVLEKGGEMESHSGYGKEIIAVPPVAKNLDLAKDTVTNIFLFFPTSKAFKSQYYRYRLNLKGSPSPMSDVEKLASQIGAAPTSARRDTPRYTVPIIHQRRCFRFAFHTCLSRHDVSFVPASAHPLQDNRPQFVVDSAFGRLRMLVFSGGTQKMTVPTAEYVKLILVGINKMEERDTMWTLLEENSGKWGKELDRVHLVVFKEEGNEWKDIASRRKAGKESMSFVGINIRISACRHWYCRVRITLVTRPEHQNREQVDRTIRAQVRVTASTVSFCVRPRQSAADMGTQQILQKLASLFVASINHGILSHTVAIVVVVGFTLSTILSRFKPGAMVKTLSKTVEETHFHYVGHKDILDESACFEDKINRLRVEAFKLQERRLEVHGDIMSWTDRRSWRRYIGETKAIWVKARQHQREIVELKKELKGATAGIACREARDPVAYQPFVVSDMRTPRSVSVVEANSATCHHKPPISVGNNLDGINLTKAVMLLGKSNWVVAATSKVHLSCGDSAIIGWNDDKEISVTLLRSLEWSRKTSIVVVTHAIKAGRTLNEKNKGKAKKPTLTWAVFGSSDIALRHSPGNFLPSPLLSKTRSRRRRGKGLPAEQRDRERVICKQIKQRTAGEVQDVFVDVWRLQKPLAMVVVSARCRKIVCLIFAYPGYPQYILLVGIPDSDFAYPNVNKDILNLACCPLLDLFANDTLSIPLFCWQTLSSSSSASCFTQQRGRQKVPR